MTRRLVAAAAVLCLLAAPALPRETAEEKARKKAWEAAKEAFAKGYRSDDPVKRREAVKALAPFADLGAAEVVVAQVLPAERHHGVLEAAVGVMACSNDPKIVGWLVGRARGRDDFLIRTAVVEALGYVESPEADRALLAILEDEKDPRVLSMALFGVAEKKLAEALDLTIGLLDHDEWQVRVAAIEALTALKDEKGVLALIDRLMNERGRLRQDIADALKSITKKNFGTDANKWRKWFHERDAMEEEAPAVKPPEPGGSTVEGPTYFGIKVLSDRVLFIIDVSMSMKTPIDIDKTKMAREAAMTGPGADEDRGDEKFENTIKWWQIKDRFDLAKAQLKFCIKNLTDEQQFEIVSFSEKVTAWNGGKLMKASARARAKAVQFVDALDVEGATAAGAALDFAFEMAGPGSFDKNYRSGVDTLFFLSDGAPTDRNEDEILEQIQGRNRLRKIKVHVVAIMNYSVRFLRLLAEQNGGIYKFFQVEDKR